MRARWRGAEDRDLQVTVDWGSQQNMLQGLSDEVVERDGVIAVQVGEYFCRSVHHRACLRIASVFSRCKQGDTTFSDVASKRFFCKNRFLK